MKRGKATNRFLDFYLGVPVLNVLASFRRKRAYSDRAERIGLLFNFALGDTLLASSATQDVRGIFPTAQLILFAGRSNMAAAKLLPGIDMIEELPITRPIKAISALRRCRLDLMLDFTSWQRITALYTLLSGARYTVGFTRDKQYRHRGYDKAVPHRGDCHELDNLHRFTRSLGAQTASAPRLLIPDGPLPEVVSRERKVIAFHAWATGTLRHLREWPDDRWADLAEQLMTPERTFVLTGSPADEPRCHALCQKIAARGIPVKTLIGRNGIAEVARALQQVEMLVSVNTGIMHLGAILGVPTVALNGPNAANRWGPLGPYVANVQTRDGSGGFLDLGFEFHGRDVMGNISIENVIFAVQQLRASVRKTPKSPSTAKKTAERVAESAQLQSAEFPGQTSLP
jgi:ADP-heptose:LPS heptosyltransferase